MTSFRNLVTTNAGARLIDILGHVALGILLPGPFWFQFLPDSCLLILFPASWFHDRLLSEKHAIVFLHKLLHTVTFPAAILAFAFILQDAVLLMLAVQWLAHVGWDAITHSGSVFAKNLLWPEMV